LHDGGFIAPQSCGIRQSDNMKRKGKRTEQEGDEKVRFRNRFR
jgi:hypothetical protein